MRHFVWTWRTSAVNAAPLNGVAQGTRVDIPDDRSEAEMASTRRFQNELATGKVWSLLEGLR